MIFIHEDPDFGKLLAMVGEARNLDEPLVEKDYWITHTLWALEQAGLDLWFKGGTSLSKGFGIIKRFSEDLDLKIEPGTSGLPPVTRWKGGRKVAVAARLAFFNGLAELSFPGLTQELMASSIDDDVESANLTIHYPGRHLEGLPTGASPFARRGHGQHSDLPGRLVLGDGHEARSNRP